MKKIFIIGFCLAAAVFALSACSPVASDPQFDRESYPRVDGSTATIPLSQNVAAKLLSLSKEESQDFIRHNKTHTAYENLMAGKADIIFVTEPSEEELKLAEDLGIELEIVPVAKEAFVFLVNKENPVDTLSTKQLQQIYQGLIKNWSEVGGPDKAIIPYQRPENSGSQTLMENQVMKGLLMMEAPKELKPSEMSMLLQVIADYDNSDAALGYSVYYYANTMYNKENTKFVKIDGVAPDNETIRKGQYPFTSAYYAVLKKTEPADSSARKLLQWILSEQGQQLVEQSGYVAVR